MNKIINKSFSIASKTYALLMNVLQRPYVNVLFFRLECCACFFGRCIQSYSTDIECHVFIRRHMFQYCLLILPFLKKVKYKEKFDKEMKGKRPEYDLKNSKIYQTLKDANTLASEVCTYFQLYVYLSITSNKRLSITSNKREGFGAFKSMCKNNKSYNLMSAISLFQVKYKGDLKKIHKPVTDMSESLAMQHNLSTSKLASSVRYFQTPLFPHHYPLT